MVKIALALLILFSVSFCSVSAIQPETGRDIMFVSSGLILEITGGDRVHFGICSETGDNVYYIQKKHPIQRWFGRGFLAIGLIGLILAR